MKTRTKILNKAGILLVAVFMVSSVIPVVAAETILETADANQFALQSNDSNIYHKGLRMNEINMDNSGSLGGSFGFTADDWIKYHDDHTENSLGLTSGGSITEAIELTDAELTGFRDYDICEIEVSIGSDDYGAHAGCDYEVWILEALPTNPDDIYTLPPEDIYATGTSGDYVWHLIDVVADYAIPDSGSVFVGVNYIDTSAGKYPCGIDESTTSPDRGGIVTYAGWGEWSNLGAIGFPGVWGLSVGVCLGGGPGPQPGEDCIEDACDFAIDGFTDEFFAMSKGVDVNGDGEIDYYTWNSLDHDICIKIANKGTIGIGELKLMADVYEKICGPTITIFDNPKYNLQEFPCCGSDYPFEFPEDGHPDNPKVTGGWLIEDDNDGDSWCLQGGEENRWDTNNQAWRCTKGEDRSFGVDADVYLGKSDSSPLDSHDTLTTPAFDIAGAACAEITFTHWCEGEYTTDEDGNVLPADYGTLAYSLNGTWVEFPMGEFLAYDNDWEKVTIKFINTEIDAGDLDYMHPYNMVCDDCMPEEGDIVIQDNLTNASLKLKFIWHKDPCLQFEGWYVDSFQVTRTEDYELELACQTHEIFELDPCDVEEGVVWEDYCFPLSCQFDDDTWYEVHIIGQVFAPQGCEADISNNEFKFQFKIQDIHDMACVDLYPTGETVTQPGESVPFNVTVRNEGTFAEDEVPVSLQYGKLIKDTIANDGFETDSLGDYTIYYFRFDECDSTVLWRWSKGDTTLDKIYEHDPCQARSRNPGSECLVFAEEGTYYPYMIEDSMSVLAFPDTLDLDPNKNWEASGEKADMGDPFGSELSFDMKYSLDIDGGTALGSYAMLGLMPNTGPASGYVLFIDNLIDLANVGTYSNDWTHFEEDDVAGMLWDRIKAWNADPTREDYDHIPECELGILVWGEGDCVDIFTATAGDGGCVNPDNPIPWTGFMFDGLYLDEITLDGTEEFATVTTGELKPGDEETFNVAWTSELCAHGITARTQLPSDVNPANDRCCAFVTHTSEFERCFDHYIEDMTGGGECLWHTCTNREAGDDYFAWAGVETERSARYINNMDDRLISPSIDISDFADEGVVINFTTWYKFQKGDFGEFSIWRTFDHDDDPETANVTKWDPFMKFEGSSNEAFEKAVCYIPESMVPAHPTKLCFRMYSDEEYIDEGWYIDDIIIYNVTDDNNSATFADAWLGYNDGHTENSIRWTDYSDWTSAIELDDDLLAGFRDYDITDAIVCTGCDDYGFEVSPLDIYYASDEMGGLPDMSTIGDDEILLFSGTSSGTGWDTFDITDYPIADSGSVYLIVRWHDYSAFPAGMDSSSTDERGGHMLSHGSDSSWTGIYTGLGYPYVWGIDAGVSPAGGGGGGLPDGAVVGDPIEVFPWADDGYIEDWERGMISPWICVPSIGGQFWMRTNDEDTIPSGAGIPGDPDDCDECDERPFTIPSEKLVPWGYSGEGAGLNDAVAFTLDLIDPTLDTSYIVFNVLMNYNLSKESIYIEFSPDWEPGTPMESATWVTYWCHTPDDSYGDNTEGWVPLADITGPIDDDDRWNIAEYAGSVVYVRFRLTTPGNGAAIGEGWAIANMYLEVKHTGIGFIDEDAPQTSIFFDEETARVTLIAQDYPINKGVGVAGTYYIVDGGEQQTYGGPFTLDEGTHTVEYWSEDHAGNVETKKSATLTVDTTPPTVNLISPEEGGIYILGNKVLTLGSKTLCIGKVPVEAEASDEGSGVNRVLFTFSNGDSGFDDEAPYEYTFRGMHFGSLTITAKAMDNNGLMSSPDEMTIRVFSLGLL